MTDSALLDQLSQMRNEVRRIGSRVAEDAISHAISCAVKGKRADMQRWIEAVIAEMRRIEARGDGPHQVE